MAEIFGVEPMFPTYASYVQKHDMMLVNDGKATPTVELVMESAAPDPEDEEYVHITLISQRTLRLYCNSQVLISRKGVNTNSAG